MLVHFEKQALIKVLAEYSNYSNVFSAENAAKFPENTGINKYAIKLKKGKQQLFGPIYSLGPVELKTLKIYIKIDLANGFIRPSKSPAKAQFYLTGSQMELFAFAWIIRVSII